MSGVAEIRGREGAARRPTLPPRAVGWLAWGLGFAVLLGLAVATPGFLSRPNLIAIANTTSVVGCVAVGMSFVTLSGNVISFSLGATASASAMAFMVLLPTGLVPAVLLTLAFAGAATAAQGMLVGWLRANPIIVSMAAFALILGVVDQALGAKVDAPGDAYVFLKGRLAGIPIASLVALAAAGLAQLILSRTELGHWIRLVGSNRRASEAAAIRVTAVVTAAYALAGTFAGLAGILLAIRYDSGDMQMGGGLEYQAIAAVLVGGMSIEGGRGSILNAIAGVLAIAVMNALTLLWGFSIEWQRMVVGLATLAAVMLQGLERWRRFP